MSALDYLVLFGVLLGIAAYGVWRTRGSKDLSGYLKGAGTANWLTIGLSVMATQASAITFISAPGQGYQSGLEFVQNYFGQPLALILVAAIFLPIFQRLKVYTAYEYLGRRFDAKTRLLGAALFLLQRGLGAGITIYAPAIVLSTVFGWRLDLTIIFSGLLVITYTVLGGNEAVNLTQKYQMAIIFAGMAIALIVVICSLPSGMSFGDALRVAGVSHKLNAVDFSTDLKKRYTIWSGLFGGLCLSLSYFGTDQSQVQRYISSKSIRESRLGLMFNALCKVPMQFLILLLGVLMFVFYQFETPPVFFNQSAWQDAARQHPAEFQRIQNDFEAAHAAREKALQTWIEARHRGDAPAAAQALSATMAAGQQTAAARSAATNALHLANPAAQTNDGDYVFITFILAHLPHGVIGLLVAVFFAAALSSKAAELSALGSTTSVDLYRHLVRREASEQHHVKMAKWFTALWGFVALGFALFAHLQENLIQAVNIIGSVFYGVTLGLFLVAFFVKWVRGTAVFYAALISEALVILLYYFASDKISYLWFNLIGCVACLFLSMALQAILPRGNYSPQI